MMPVLNTADALYVGSDLAAAAYLGADKVWPTGGGGMVLLTPTSITHSGTSASVGANGQVTFTAVTSLSLNGVFSADFDNYLIVGFTSVSVSGRMHMQLVDAGGTPANASKYTYQRLRAISTDVAGLRGTGEWRILNTDNQCGFTVHLYGPYLSQATAMRAASHSDGGGAAIYDFAATHSDSSSFTSLTLSDNGDGVTYTGTLQVYGIRS